MEGKNRLKEFVNSIQLKISIAVAVAVIRTKPFHLSAEEHARTVQEQFLLYWKNAKKKEEENSFESRIISLQQSKICNSLVNILPSIPDYNPLSDSFISSCNDSHDSGSETELEVDNAEFINAIVRLRFAVDSKNTLPVHNVQKMTRSILYRETKIQVTEIEDDSGFESCKKSVEEINTQTISSSIFRPITHSSDTEFLITKSVESVLRYVHRLITDSPEQSFYQWQGSVLEHICLILKKAAGIGNFCSDLIVALVKNVLNSIWKSNEINKHTTWEYECLLLAKFCCNEYICTEILNFLLEKLNELTDHVKFMIEKSEKTSDTFLIEKSPHFIQLNTILLNKWKRFTLRTTPKNSSNDSFERVTDLWKTKWQSVQSEKHNRADRTAEDWKQCYEKLLIMCTNDFPLVTLQMWDLIKVIDSEV